MKKPFCMWSELRVFLAVVRAGSTLAASRKLGMAQPTVARRIEALEHALGLVLFDKDTRGFRPTSAGREILPEAEAMEAAAEALCSKVGKLTAVRAIRITAFTHNFSPRAMAIFDDFAELHPEVTFEFLPGMRPLDLMAGEADIALRLTRAAPHPDLVCRKISTAQFTLYGSESYAEAHGLPRSIDDMKHHRVVSFRRPDVQPWHHDWTAKAMGAEGIAQVYGEVDLLNAAIASGRALGIMNVRLAEATGGLLRCFDPVEELEAQHLLLVAPEAWRRPEVKAFVKFFAPRYTAIFRD